jgi:hypothetical protein
MGKEVFVLTALTGGKTKEWRPVGVVTSMDTADLWAREGETHDWIPFELDDMSLTGISTGTFTEFRPRKPLSGEDKARETARRLEETNKRLLSIIEQLKNQKRKRGTAKSPLLSEPGSISEEVE